MFPNNPWSLEILSYILCIHSLDFSTDLQECRFLELIFCVSPPSLIFCLNFCWIPFLSVTSNSNLWFLNSVSLPALFGISFLNHGPESFFWPKLGQLQIPSHVVSSSQGSQACSTYYSMFENSYFVDFFGRGFLSGWF